MTHDVSRGVLSGLLPPGSLWVPEIIGDFDLLLNGISENMGEVVDDVKDLAYLRDPYRIPLLLLPDLELEYGILPDSNKTETQRRAGLAAMVYNRTSGGDLDTLQDKLDQAGFDLTVYANDPAVDPDIFVSGVFPTQCDVSTSVCGYSGACCGFKGGEGLLVNGDVFDDSVFESPADSGYWPLIFFVGGEATYDGEGGLATIEMAEVAAARRSEIKRLILKYKPMHSWCGLIIYFS